MEWYKYVVLLNYYIISYSYEEENFTKCRATEMTRVDHFTVFHE